jgi:hypothetical protein
MPTRDFETIRRSIYRKVAKGRPRNSFPFLSGDTYQSSCDLVLNSNFIELIELLGQEKIQSHTRVFISARYASDFFDWVHSNPEYKFNNWNLIIHNWDDIPTPEKFQLVTTKFRTISSVNWLGSQSQVRSIPIGLENWSLHRNGVPADFRKIQKRGLPDFNNRPIKLMCNFSLSTNFSERRLALDYGQAISGAKVVLDPITPSRYRRYLADSKFVLSPPGNGPDCHRTWESMYLGAIPIVLKSAWPFNHLELPVLVVNSWSDIQSAIESFSLSQIRGYMSWDNVFLEDM